MVIRPPLVGLTLREAPPGSIAFVSVMLGSVAFDGLSRIGWWEDRRVSVASAAPDLFELTGTVLSLAGLLLAVGFVAVAYLAAVELARMVAGSRDDYACLFLASLIPIALVYAISHYFTLLIVQGQFAIPLASDPLGRGWDVLGSAGYVPNIAPLAPNTIWYIQVAVLVAGHVLALILAHDRAVATAPSTRQGLRSQYPLLALMVLYTVGGLWLLAQE